MNELRLENFDPALFLRDYWQKKPLLIPAAFPDFKDPLGPDELAGLALEADIESRLISNLNGDNSWQLRHGPFNESDFAIPDHNWTLLVQAVDHYLPEVQAILAAFRFIPDWRIDDLMVSYASDQGSVGPHFDNYDVFLIQGLGQRRWLTGQHCEDNEALLPHPDLKILEQFQTEQEYLLNPGDILYIPPRLAHWGIAEGEAMTYSVGFRTPSYAEMISHWCDHLLNNDLEQQHLKDGELKADQHPAEITPAALSQLKSVMQGLLDKPEQMESWFAALVTESKYGNELPTDQHYSEEDTQNIIRQGAHLLKYPEARFAFIRRSDHLALFVNGQALNSELATPEFIEHLCANNKLNGVDLAEFSSNNANLNILTELLNLGCFDVE